MVFFYIIQFYFRSNIMHGRISSAGGDFNEYSRQSTVVAAAVEVNDGRADARCKL